MKSSLVCAIAAAAMALSGACGVVPGFETPSAWKIENYMNALSMGIEDGALRIKGTGKQKDTAWTVRSVKTPVPPGTKELSISVKTTSSRNLSGGGTGRHSNSVLWLDADGRELKPSALGIPAIVGVKRLAVVAVVEVPAAAKYFHVQMGFDWPDFRKDDSLELADIKIAAHSQAGTVKPGLELPDMRPVTIERKSASPFEDAFAPAVFTLTDPVGIDWDSLNISVDGVDFTGKCSRAGDDVIIQPPQTGWSNGLHIVSFAVDSRRDNVRANERRAFYRGATPKTPKVTLRDDGLTLVDGKAFFPLGAYGVNYDKRMPEVSLDKAHENLKSAGFDFAQTYGNVYKQPERDLAVAKHGFRQWVWAQIPDADFLERGRFNAHIAAWYLGDDTASYISPEELRFYDSAVKAADPTRITAQADATFAAALEPHGRSRYSSYVTASDVFMPEIYPFKGTPGNERFTNAVATVCRDMKIIKRDVRLYNDGKPRGCWPILQAFVGWKQWEAFPSLEQIYSTSMAAIVHGAHGMIWYTYCGSRKDYGFATSPERWEAMRYTSLKIRELVPVLVERTPAKQPTVAILGGPDKDPLGGRSVTCLMKRHNGETYLLAVNSSPNPVRARFDGLQGCEDGEVKWEARRVLCRNGSLEDLFAPFAVHVYRFARTYDKPERGALLLTFDDANYDSWVKYIALFEKYGAKVTFFPSGELGDAALEKLAQLRKAGHTLGSHTVDHVNVPQYVQEHGEDVFWEKQVAPHLRAYGKIGVEISSFAYPNGRRNAKTDEILLRRGFKRIRGGGDGVKEHRVTFYDRDGSRAAEWKPVAENDYAFNSLDMIHESKRFFGALVGESYHTDIDDLCAAIKRAARENRLLQFTSHDIAPDAKRIHMKEEWLVRILQTAVAEGVKIIGYDQLPLKGNMR